jgi:hypothetical protein
MVATINAVGAITSIIGTEVNVNREYKQQEHQEHFTIECTKSNCCCFSSYCC